MVAPTRFGLGLVKAVWTNAEIRDAIPIGMILATAMVAVLWNLHAGIRFRAPLIEALATPAWPFAIMIFYMTVRPDKQIAETALYLALILVYTTFGVQLSYLGQTLDYPLRDADFAKLDFAMAFDARIWFDFLAAHPWLRDAQTFAYNSYYWLPLASVPIFATFRPGRNCEMLTGIIIGATAAIIIAAFIPAMSRPTSPAAPWVHLIEILRSGAKEPLPYSGALTFPSLHAVVATLLIISHRGIRWTFAPVLLVNALTLVSLPVIGDHYLVDVLAGALIGVCSFLLAKTFNDAIEPFAARSVVQRRVRAAVF